MHPKNRENALSHNILPMLLLADILSKLPIAIIQRGTGKHFKHNRERLAANNLRAAPAPSSTPGPVPTIARPAAHLTLSRTGTPWLGAL
jgi:hypothetical protein